MASLTKLFLIGICTLGLVNNSLTEKASQSHTVEDISELQKVAVVSIESVRLTDDSIRNRRSSYYNDDEDDYFQDYSDGPDARHLKHGHKKKKHQKPLLLELLGGQGGCRGQDCGGVQGWQTGGHNQGSHGSQGGSFASASAGSVGGSPHHGGGQSQASASAGSVGGSSYQGAGEHSQANAQSASFNFGPYTATFSVAQASAGNRHDGIRDYYDY